MSRVRTRRLFWSPSPSTDVVGYAVYAAPAGDTTFIPKVDAGTVAPLFANVATSEAVLSGGAIPEGTWQFAVCAIDDAGNYSDPYQAATWVNVPLDLTAPQPPPSGDVD
jgi:hypothetical protein